MGTAAEPAYRRVVDDLRLRIHSGVLEPGGRVPSRNAIITRYGVGETAAKHALGVLIAEGLIEARPGSGCYVRRHPAPACLEHDRPHFPGSPFGLRQFPDPGSERVPGQAQVMTARVTWEHQTELAQAPPRIAARLGLAQGTSATRTIYLMRADGEPVQLATSYEPAALTAGTLVALPEQGPLAGRGVIERMRSLGLSVDEVTEEVSARPALRVEALALGGQPGALVLVTERTHHAAGRVVETAEVIVPAERFRLRYRFPVPAGAPAGRTGRSPDWHGP